MSVTTAQHYDDRATASGTSARRTWAVPQVDVVGLPAPTMETWALEGALEPLHSCCSATVPEALPPGPSSSVRGEHPAHALATLDVGWVPRPLISPSSLFFAQPALKSLEHFALLLI